MGTASPIEERFVLNEMDWSPQRDVITQGLHAKAIGKAFCIGELW